MGDQDVRDLRRDLNDLGKVVSAHEQQLKAGAQFRIDLDELKAISPERRWKLAEDAVSELKEAVQEQGGLVDELTGDMRRMTGAWDGMKEAIDASREADAAGVQAIADAIQQDRDNRTQEKLDAAQEKTDAAKAELDKANEPAPPEKVEPIVWLRKNWLVVVVALLVAMALIDSVQGDLNATDVVAELKSQGVVPSTAPATAVEP